MAVSTGTSPGASAISNIPFMAASSHDGLTSGIYQRPHIPRERLFLRFSSAEWFSKDQQKAEMSRQWLVCLESREK